MILPESLLSEARTPSALKASMARFHGFFEPRSGVDIQVHDNLYPRSLDGGRIRGFFAHCSGMDIKVHEQRSTENPWIMPRIVDLEYRFLSSEAQKIQIMPRIVDPEDKFLNFLHFLWSRNP